MKKLILGLDIGITSVGWGIIDLNDNDIVDAGVRIFPERTAAENVSRRSYRSARRLLRRKQQRIKDLKAYLKKIGIINSDFQYLDNPYHIRVKGLTEKLSNDDLATALLSICNRRGASFKIVEDDVEKAKDAASTKTIISKNEKILKEKNLYISEYLVSKLDNGENIRGVDNVFKSQTYEKELNAILKNQDLDSNTITEIKNIIFRKREYYEGPGSIKSPTPYGRYYIEDGKIKFCDLIEKMRGKCSVYPDQLRAPKMSYSAELFNFLNDLNNLTVDGNKITTEQKKELIEKLNKKSKITPTQLKKFLKADDISGFRVNKNYEPLLTELTGYKIIKKTVEDNHLDKEIYENKDYVDSIIEILTRLKGIDERKIELSNLNQNLFTENVTNVLANISGITGYHALSFKALRNMIPELIETNENQMQILTRTGLLKSKKEDMKGLKNIPFDEETVLSPVAKRSINEAIKVINAIRKRYGELDSIIIEMPRDRNSEDRRKRIQDEQRFGEVLNTEIEELVKGMNVRLNAKLRRKLRLYKEQDGKCLYSGDPIDLHTLIYDDSAYDIDHIIPISISFDDSMANKVVVKSDYNRLKSNLTPFLFFQSGKAYGWNFNEFETYVKDLQKRKLINRKKLKYLLEKRNITKYDVMKEFINRNLVDTRYASRVILNTLTEYFRVNSISTTVHTIRGSLTSIFRKVTQIDKNRDESYHHHAIDALIVASMKKMNYINDILAFKVDNYGNVISKDTGEIVEIINENEFFDPELLKFIVKLREIGNKDNTFISISHKVDKKPNRQLMDDTLYGVKNYDGTNYRIAKYTDIYGQDGIKVANLILNGDDDKLLIKQHDPKSYELLKKIVQEYSYDKKISPFALYKEQHGYIRKYSKNGNGPIIKSLKFKYEKLGNHVDITHKYMKDYKEPRVIMLHPRPYRTDFYVNNKGEYKFVTIRYIDIKKCKDNYVIDKDKYLEYKKTKGIDENFQFAFSLHTNEIVEIHKLEKDKLTIIEGRFLGTGNDKTNLIELKGINREFQKRGFVTIGKKITKIQKYHVDILGKKYKVLKEDLQLIL
ncbi:MAG TPA: type II CRISPR RNA-guided endonuclease Cas9 [Acholeplasmataceae bacterium]|nr:type II CRISPR RNA-guided endonuclease Cas9 [Acholeplasmataceae bacterium]